MLRAIIKKEMLLHLASFRFATCTLITVVLAALAAFVGTEDYKARRDSYLSQLEKHELELQETRVYSHLQPKVIRGPELLSVLDRGIDARLGTEVQVEAFVVPRVATGHYRGSGVITSLRDLGFDLTTIVRVVLGLLALLMTFDAFVGERQRGTLCLVFANDVQRESLLAGKFWGAFLTLMIPLTLGLVLVVAIVSNRAEMALDSQQLLRVLGLWFAYAGYGSIMLWVGLVLSLFARRASSALAAALLIWLLAVFLVPQATTTLARGLAVAWLDQEAIEAAIAEEEARHREALQKINREFWPLAGATSHRFMAQENAGTHGRLFRFGSADYYDQLSEVTWRSKVPLLAHAERTFAIRAEVDSQLRVIEKSARLVGSLSPAAALDRVSESLVGTSTEDHRAFLSLSREYRCTLLSYLHEKDAFKGWRWFTDDDPENPQRWISLVGTTAQAVDTEEFQYDEHFMKTLREAGIEADNNRQPLRFDDLPPPVLGELTLFRAVSRVSWEVALLVFSLGALTILALRQVLAMEILP